MPYHCLNNCTQGHMTLGAVSTVGVVGVHRKYRLTGQEIQLLWQPHLEPNRVSFGDILLYYTKQDLWGILGHGTYREFVRCTSQTSGGLGYHVLVYCKGLNLFLWHTFSNIQLLCGWGGDPAFKDWHCAFAIVHCDLTEAVTYNYQISHAALHGLKCCRMKSTDETARLKWIEFISVHASCVTWGPFYQHG